MMPRKPRSLMARLEALERRLRPAQPLPQGVLRLARENGAQHVLMAVRECHGWPLTTTCTWQRHEAEAEDDFIARILAGCHPAAILLEAQP